MSTILLINDTEDHDNWGSQACADTLKQIIQVANKNTEIRSVHSKWINRSYLTINIPLFGEKIYWERNRLYNRFARSFNYLPKIADEFEITSKEWLNGKGGPGAKEIIEQLQGVDAVVFNAEGSTYRNNYSATKSLFILWFAKTNYGIPGYFLNGSITLTDVDPILPGMIRKVFPLLDGITIREPVSFKNLKKYIPDIKADLVPDSVFYLDTSTAESAKTLKEIRERLGEKPYFCFSLSMLPMDYQRSPNESLLYHLIVKLKKIGLQAILMAKDGSDQFLEDLAIRTNSIFWGPSHGYVDLVSLLKGAKFLISGRYHHVIMASMMGCPTIPLTTTSHKMEGLCELLEGEIGQPYDATNLWPSLEKINHHALQLYENGHLKRTRLLEISCMLKKQTLMHGLIIQRTLNMKL